MHLGRSTYSVDTLAPGLGATAEEIGWDLITSMRQGRKGRGKPMGILSRRARSRAFQRTRFIVLGVVGLLLIPLAAWAVLDLTGGGSGDINGARFEYFNPDSATGTGRYNSFLRLQADPEESGYNTDGTVEFDTKDDVHTHSVLLS